MKSAYSIGELARATGVGEPALRMWEARFGFPSPERTPSGHRRYSDDDLAAVERVVAERGAGLSLGAAIARARSVSRPDPRSLHAAVRGRRPELTPQLMRKPALDAISHAIEDEFLSNPAPAVVFGAFQRRCFYAQARRRWRELGSAAELCVVFADFDRPRLPPDGPAEVPLESDDPLGHEWAVICDGPAHAACMVGWERPQSRPVADSERSFEVIWTVEAEAVRDVARIAAGRVREAIPELRSLPSWIESPAAPGSAALRRATRLSNRMISYLASREDWAEEPRRIVRRTSSSENS